MSAASAVMAFSMLLLATASAACARAEDAAAGAEFAVELKDVPPEMTARFRLWLPPSVGPGEVVRGVICASDYQAGASLYTAEPFRALADRLRFGMVLHKLFRKEGDRNGPSWDKEAAGALLRGLVELAKASKHAEVAHACMIHTGLSWSGMQAPGLASAMPERSLGVVTYHSRGFADDKAAYGVPLLVLIAEYDQFMTPLDVAEDVLKARAAGALWAGCYQAGGVHEHLGDPQPAIDWIEEVVALRLPKKMPADGRARLNPLEEKSGFLGELRMDAQTRRRAGGASPATVAAFADFRGDKAKAFWLPNERVARSWLKWTSLPDPTPHAKRPTGEFGSPDKPVPVPPAPGRITVDGDLADWADVKPLPSPFSGKNPGSLRLCWDSSGLFGALTARDTGIRSDPQSPWTGDCLELFIEKDFARSPQRSRAASQYIVAPGAEGGPAVLWPADLKGRLRAAWKPIKDGYTIEFSIPAALLAPAKMQAGTKMGFNFALSDDGKAIEVFYCSKDFGGFAIPALWGAVELVGPQLPQGR
jgi:hypothetical protein